MNGLHAEYSKKGQLKIQQMAFVLLAFMLLFGLVLMFYVSLRLSGLEEDVNTLRHEQTQELVRRLASSPEFAWTLEDCASCVDLDKVYVLKNHSGIYSSIWGQNVKVLRIQTAYPVPTREIECNSATYPHCNRITLRSQQSGYSTDEAFVALCRLEGNPISKQCTLGKIIMGVENA